MEPRELAVLSEMRCIHVTAMMRHTSRLNSPRGGIHMGDYLLLLCALAGVVIVAYAFWAPDLQWWVERMRDNKR